MHVETLVKLEEHSQDLLDFWERELIRTHGTKAPAGYNLDDGGRSGGVRSEETKQKTRDTYTRKSKESGYKGRIIKTKGRHYQVLWRHHENVGVYLTEGEAIKARDYFLATGNKHPSLQRIQKEVGVSCRKPNSSEVLTFPSGKQAADHIGCSAVFVTMVCNNTYKGRNRLAKGWKCWYAEDEEYD